MAPSDKAEGAFELKSHYNTTERYAEESLVTAGSLNTTDALVLGYGDTKDDVQDMRRLGKKREFELVWGENN
ncbi:hypothetical protein ACMFMG_006646 [Clarireedia jacksonii]